MNKFFCFIVTLFVTTITLTAQEKLERKWSNAEENLLEFNQGSFQQKSKDIESSGDYIYQNNLLIMYYQQPKDTVITYRISELTDSTLVFKNNLESLSYNYKQPTVAKVENTPTLESKGFTFYNLWRGIIGIAIIIFIAFLLSSDKKNISWRLVGFGISAQICIAFGITYVPAIQWFFEVVSSGFVSVLDYTRAGSIFLLGNTLMDTQSFGFVFIFQILPTVIFFSALTSVLFYLGVLQIVVKGLAWVMTKTLKISGAESLAVAGNIFLGQTEAPLMIKAYLEKMNKSEIFLVMTGGMATLAGGVLAAYIDMLGSGDEVMRLLFAKQLLMASIMAAPGAIVIAKILVPQTEKIDTSVKVSSEKIGSNFLDSIAIGTTEGLKLAANVGAMLLVFVAFIAMINGILGGIGDLTHLNGMIASSTDGRYDALSLEYILGTIFSPLAYAIGTAWEDAQLVGRLLGEKLIASEFIAYSSLTDLKNAGAFSEMKSIVISTFMLSGFANIASIGIQIGGIGSLAPGKRALLSKYGMKAVIGGMLASLLSATLAGILIG
ncbi:concentrative nucleoside transporter, CNT family [Pustulibacterium marinum]|uniref:Concentrative nucleoside transporter, CNT family n=1 Tax=Pustulibacterium marinum TaxID=1224947 RepID=A0A1I7GPW2_9FLAO|nr:nucleoside transporter C-terminal domain-containing protein [Pustulibacterium marinum]SFU50475.1 concentrative nucleoside transporter, CNT family [Pustulibacterium marinum]